MRLTRVLNPAVVATLAATLFACGAAWAAPGGPPDSPADDTVSTTISDDAARRAVDYWTPERMASAVPMPGPDDRLSRGTFSSRPALGRTPGPVPGGPKILADPADPEPRSGSKPSANPEVFLEEQAKPYTSPAARTVGRVFGSYGIKNYYCSATAINSPNRSLVWTAGHCMVDEFDTKWLENWIFVPAYGSDGPMSKPYGSFSAVRMEMPSDFFYNRNFHRDFGAAVVGTAWCGFYAAETCVENRRLTTAVGGQGLAWNYSRTSNFEARGYPGAGDIADDQFFCRGYGNKYGWDAESGSGEPYMLSIPCGLAKGSSGGPWLVNMSCGGTCVVDQWAWVASTVSIGEKYGGKVIELHGPYQDWLAKALYELLCCV